MVNQQTLQGNWNEIKGRLCQRWGQLTEDDLREFNGSVDQLIGTIQRKTGESREQIEAQLESLMERASRGAERARESLQQYGHQATQMYSQMAGNIRAGYSDVETMVRRNPAESVAVAFGAGLVAGVIIGLVARQ
jgi:uncharacterized protein YjbJ (UPF0337 family)